IAEKAQDITEFERRLATRISEVEKTIEEEVTAPFREVRDGLVREIGSTQRKTAGMVEQENQSYQTVLDGLGRYQSAKRELWAAIRKMAKGRPEEQKILQAVRDEESRVMGRVASLERKIKESHQVYLSRAREGTAVRDMLGRRQLSMLGNARTQLGRIARST